MTQFMVYGRNAGDWILLKDVSGLIYTTATQKKRIHLNNNTPYNHFKFDNLKTGDPSNCVSIIQSMDLYADNVMGESTERMYPESGEACQWNCPSSSTRTPPSPPPSSSGTRCPHCTVPYAR